MFYAAPGTGQTVAARRRLRHARQREQKAVGLWFWLARQSNIQRRAAAAKGGRRQSPGHFNVEMPWRLREQTPAVEAQAQFICAVKRRRERVLNFENVHFQS